MCAGSARWCGRKTDPRSGGDYRYEGQRQSSNELAPCVLAPGHIARSANTVRQFWRGASGHQLSLVTADTRSPGVTHSRSIVSRVVDSLEGLWQSDKKSKFVDPAGSH